MSDREPIGSSIVINGLSLHYLDWGGIGKTILLYHATGLLGRVYRPIASMLTSVGHVISLDQRGHGESDPAPDGIYDWQALVEDLRGFVAAMGLREFYGFGHSAGATALGALAQQHSELVSRVVLCEPVLFGSRAPDSLGMAERTRWRKTNFASVDEMFARLGGKPPFSSWRPDILRDYCEYGTFLNRQGRRELRCAREIEARFYETAAQYDGLRRLLASEAPALLIFGGQPGSIGALISDYVASRIKRGRVVNLPGTGHFAPLEMPDRIARLTVDFFTQM